jgi:RND family efflux transporter MFP subunit
MSVPKPALDDLRIARGARPEPARRLLPFVIVLAVLALAGLAAWMMARPRPLQVRTATARESSGGSGERTVLNASGYVTARREATVSSKVTGKVTEVLIEEGMKVQAGQVLARLDETNVRVSLQLAEAQLESARAAIGETKARLREAEQELARQSDLLKDKVSAQADYDHAEAAVLAYRAREAQQQADVISAERGVSVWRQQLDDMVIRAPFAGVVTSKNAQPGEMISPISAGGGFTRTGICTIVDMESLEIEIDVNESYINRVQPDQPVEGTLDAYPDWKIPCRVIAIIPTADRDKSTVKVRVRFEKLDPRILPEMSVKVAFQETGGAGVAATKLVLVPNAAVQKQEGRDVVMVVRAGRAERRAVAVSATGPDETAIGAGLSAGDKVILDWPADLKSGAEVREIQP